MIQKYKSIVGFTLMELMVVICIIAVLFVTVGFRTKKVYEDFAMSNTMNELLVLENSCRSYYLIYNEFPKDTGNEQIYRKLVDFVPSYYFKRQLTDNYFYLNISPYKGNCYDIDNWIDATHYDAKPYFVVTAAYPTSKTRKEFEDYFVKRYPYHDLYIWNMYGIYWFSLFFNEMRDYNENRYH